MPNFLQVTGQRYGRLVALERYSPRRVKHDKYATEWWCQCDCGALAIVNVNNLRAGTSRSCGCIKNPHGMCKTTEYVIWQGMIERCTNLTYKRYQDYGGRGITVCDRWRSFVNFYADMGPRPSSRHSLDRINNDLGYEPNNVRWATAPEQLRNKRDNHWITLGGETRVQADWLKRFGIHHTTLDRRLKRWPAERTHHQSEPYGALSR